MLAHGTCVACKRLSGEGLAFPTRQAHTDFTVLTLQKVM